MLFNSIHFLVFFVSIVFLYFLVDYRKRWILLLLGSCYFYMSYVPYYILVLFLIIIIDYSAALLIEQAPHKRKYWMLVLSITSNLGILIFFKYYGFIASNLNPWLGPNLYDLPVFEILLPIGLSFHTFQAMSYTIEVYKGRTPAERHLGYYALYVLFFPQLVAGPIERPQILLHQFKEKHVICYDRVVIGLKLMAWGFFKKIVIADRLGILVDYVYADPLRFSGGHLFFATLFFAFQIYCDFSGYTDIARGAARILGIHLSLNFDAPYQSISVREFWQKWHITLYIWFRDYVYIPLGGNKGSFLKSSLIILLVFLLSGLWHGANWTFIAWGVVNGFYIVLERYLSRSKWRLVDRLPFLKNIFVLFLVTLSWVFFRSDSLSTAFGIFHNMYEGLFDIQTINLQVFTNPIYMGLSRKDLLFSVLLILFMEVVQYIHLKYNLSRLLKTRTLLRWTMYYGIILFILFLGVYENRHFVYFQF